MAASIGPFKAPSRLKDFNQDAPEQTTNVSVRLPSASISSWVTQSMSIVVIVMAAISSTRFAATTVARRGPAKHLTQIGPDDQPGVHVHHADSYRIADSVPAEPQAAKYTPCPQSMS